jgi:hypothetical protein
MGTRVWPFCSLAHNNGYVNRYRVGQGKFESAILITPNANGQIQRIRNPRRDLHALPLEGA